MAWAPSTSFEDDLVDLQPNLNFIHGQLAYEEKRMQEYTSLPKPTNEYLANREKRKDEVEKFHSLKSKEIGASIAMMERIQEIAGTKPLGEHATMADWDDTSTVEKEAVAMVRHFGMMSMSDGLQSLPMTEPMPEGKIYVMRNGRRSYPLILDPTYFEPGKTRKISKPSNNSTENTTCDSKCIGELNKFETRDTVYASSSSCLGDTETSLDEKLNTQHELNTVKNQKAKRSSLSQRMRLNP